LISSGALVAEVASAIVAVAAAEGAPLARVLSDLCARSIAAVPIDADRIALQSLLKIPPELRPSFTEHAPTSKRSYVDR
jgi:hypothetical protein